MQKPLAIFLAALMILSTAFIAGPALLSMSAPTAYAGTLGTITASSAVINGTQVIQITVSDPDIGGTSPASNLPSITVNKASRIFNTTLAANAPIIAYQAIGGSWIAYLNVTYGNDAVQGGPIPFGGALAGFNARVQNFPQQDPTAPSGGFDNSISNGLQNEPNLAAAFTSAAAPNTVGLENIINRVTTTGAGDSFTVTYNDADPPASVSVSITVNSRTGSIFIDRATYGNGSKVYITITDPDLNVDPTNATSLHRDTTTTPPRNFYNATVSPEVVGVPDLTFAGDGSLEETGPNTGVFEDIVTIAPAVTPGSTITVRYRDSAAPAGTDTRTTAASISSATGTLALDKSSYKVSEAATITLTDPDLNLDSRAPAGAEEYTGGGATAPQGGVVNGTSRVFVKSQISNAQYQVRMAETGVNTGIFTGTFFFKFGGLGVLSVAGSSPTINGTGSTIYTVSYFDARNAAGAAATTTTTATLSTTTGTVTFDRATYTATTQIGTVTVTDPDVNTDSGTVQSIPLDDAGAQDAGTVRIESTSDVATPRSLLLTETGPNTGVFKGSFALTTGAGAFGGAPTIKVADGAVLTARYKDSIDVNANANVDVTGTAAINLATNSGTIALDKATYAPGQTFQARITDPDLNGDAAVKETIAAAAAPIVFGGALGGSGIDTGDSWISHGGGALTETDVNTGIFEGTHPVPANTTFNQIMTVRYTDAADVTGAAATADVTANINANTGTVSLDKSSYPIGGKVKVTVTDPDRNINPTGEDTFSTPAAAGQGTTSDGIVLFGEERYYQLLARLV